jgi:hypothetical protein
MAGKAPEIRWVGELHRFDVRPSDKFILSVPTPISGAQADHLKRAWKEFIGGDVPLLIMEEGMKLGVFGDGILWCCHVRGPDDVHAAPNYATALEWSDRFNDWWARQPKSENDPIIRAAPALWPWSADAHAENLKQTAVEFADGKLP